MPQSDPHLWTVGEWVIAIMLAVLAGVAKAGRQMVRGIKISPWEGLARLVSVLSGGIMLGLLSAGVGLNGYLVMAATSLGGALGVDVYDIAREELEKHRDKWLK